MTEHKVGNIYQIDPSLDPIFGGQYLVATEIKTWGIQGYLLLDRPDDGSLIRANGFAFLRKKYGEIVLVGFSEWLAIRDEGEE